MKRAIFLFIVIVAVAFIGYWICIEVCGGEKNMSIVFLQVNNPQEESKKLIDELVKIYNENEEEMNIEFYFEPGIEKKFTFQPDDWSSENEVTQMIKDSITSYLSQYKFNKLTNEQANVQIGSMIHLLAETKAERRIFLFGSFPDCYKDKDVNKVIKDSKKNLSGLKENNNTVYWMIRTNDDEPEQKLLEVFKKYNIDVKNKQINVSTRKCGGDSIIKYQKINLEFAILSQVDTSLAQKIEKKAFKLFSQAKNITVGFVNINKSIKKDYNTNQISAFKNDLSELLITSKDVDLRRYKFIFKATFDKYRNNLKDTAFFFIVGKQPTRTKRLYNFRHWRKRESQKIFLHFTPRPYQNIIQNVFQNIFLFETIN